MGGLSSDALLSAAMEAPGLKLKSGSAGERLGLSALGGLFSLKVERLGLSIADCGLRPEAREYDEGAEEEPGRAGKMKGGFGGGMFRGEVWSPSRADCVCVRSSIGSIEGKRWEAGWSKSKELSVVAVASIALSGPKAVAIMIQPLFGTLDVERLRRT